LRGVYNTLSQDNFMLKIPKKYDFAVIASDVSILTVKDGQLQVLLIKMKKEPYTEHWALPGGLVKPEESVDQAARRILADKAGISDVYLEQLYTFGDPKRDPFGRVVSVAYFALLDSHRVRPKTSAEYTDINWYPVKNLPKLAYDHADIISTSVHRLKSKLSYTNIIYGLLPSEFTLGEMQKNYEIILGKKLDKRNFRKKIISLGLVKKLNKKKVTGPNRPAVLYCFKDRSPKNIEIL
jgi:8-oxo-dGTP diphosphatase